MTPEPGLVLSHCSAVLGQLFCRPVSREQGSKRGRGSGEQPGTERNKVMGFGVCFQHSAKCLFRTAGTDWVSSHSRSRTCTWNKDVSHQGAGSKGRASTAQVLASLVSVCANHVINSFFFFF